MTEIKKLIDAYSSYILSQEINSFDQDPDLYFKSLSDEWLEKEDENLGSIPIDTINGLEALKSQEDFIDLLSYIGKTLIVDCPSFLMDYLERANYSLSGLEHILRDDIIEENFEESYMDKDKRERFERYRQAIFLVERFPSLIGLLIEAYEKTHPTNEIIHENIAKVIDQLKDYEPVISYINSLANFEYRHLSIGLLLLKYEDKGKAYYSLRQIFKRADRPAKNILVYVFSLLGDARAVPLLRKYASDYVRESKETLSEKPEEAEALRRGLSAIFTSITQLGGNVEDLEKF